MHYATFCHIVDTLDEALLCTFKLKYFIVCPSGVQRHPRRRKMRHRNPWGTKIWNLKGDKIYLFVSREIIVATRGEIFSLKFTKYRLAAGLRLDPLGELKCSPILPSRNKGAYF